MSIESDVVREIDFAAIINDFAVAKWRESVWPLNLDFVLDVMT